MGKMTDEIVKPIYSDQNQRNILKQKNVEINCTHLLWSNQGTDRHKAICFDMGNHSTNLGYPS